MEDRPGQETLHLTFGSMVIEAQLILEDRLHLSIKVYPDKQVIIKAPIMRLRHEIGRAIQRRLGWIAKQVEYFDQFHPLAPEKQYISGETFLYLGRQYRLRISSGPKATVKLVRGFFLMELPESADREKAAATLRKWYSSHAALVINRHLERYLETFKKLGASLSSIRIRRMKMRWGSCSSSGVITINSELVKAPIHCIEYVFVHELCHLVHPQHDKDFYRLLSRLLPDWELRKKRLEMIAL